MFVGEISIIFTLILLNAFFALSELAILSAKKPLLKRKAKKGSKSAKIALELAEDSGIFLSTVQVGITLIGILAGAYGGATIAEGLEPILNKYPLINPHGETLSVALVVTFITYLSVVIGELIPKQIAISNPEKFAMIAARPMKILSTFCKPIVKILNFSGNLLMKIFGITENKSKITEDEVKAFMAEGVEHGVIDKAENDIFNRIIMLADRDLKSIMTPRSEITFIDINDSNEVIRKKIHSNGHSRYPITDGNEDNVVGIIQSKKILDQILSGKAINIKKIMQKVRFLHEKTNCLAALEVFRTKRVHVIIVIDEYGGIEGLITSSDILEAIVGTLPANYDLKDDALIISRDDGSWLIDGKTPLEEIYLTLEIEELSKIKDFSTLSGWLLSEFNTEPKEAEFIERYGYKFEIVDKDSEIIDKVLITRQSL